MRHETAFKANQIRFKAVKPLMLWRRGPGAFHLRMKFKCKCFPCWLKAQEGNSGRLQPHPTTAFPKDEPRPLALGLFTNIP